MGRSGKLHDPAQPKRGRLEIEHAEAGQPEQQRFDLSALRRELGIQ
jgi:hypothetical protein